MREIKWACRKDEKCAQNFGQTTCRCDRATYELQAQDMQMCTGSSVMEHGALAGCCKNTDNYFDRMMNTGDFDKEIG
jgi:hypothetical protein